MRLGEKGLPFVTVWMFTFTYGRSIIHTCLSACHMFFSDIGDPCHPPVGANIFILIRYSRFVDHCYLLHIQFIDAFDRGGNFFWKKTVGFRLSLLRKYRLHG